VTHHEKKGEREGGSREENRSLGTRFIVLSHEHPKFWGGKSTQKERGEGGGRTGTPYKEGWLTGERENGSSTSPFF